MVIRAVLIYAGESAAVGRDSAAAGLLFRR
jgi:hypothetical protein